MGFLLIGAAHVAIHGSGSEIVPDTDRVLTSGGSTTILIPAGARTSSRRPASVSSPCSRESTTSDSRSQTRRRR